MVKLLLTGGKGGVGKTTMACSLALWTSERGFRTLVVSSDPAHSTSDSLGTKLKDIPTKVKNNLWGVEIDPRRSMEELYPSLRESIEGAGFEGLDFTTDEMMIPGLDEALAFDLLLRFVESADYDLVIFDTAPTGHTLRFLSIPDLLDGWIAKLLKFRHAIKKIKLLVTGKKDMSFKEVRKLQKRVEHIRRVLSDPKLTAFYLVLIPELMALEETARARKVLGDYRIPVAGLIVNNLIPYSWSKICKNCKTRRGIQQKYLEMIRDMGEKVVEVELFAAEVHGTEKLLEIGKRLGDQIEVDTVRSLDTKLFKNHYEISLYFPGAKQEDMTLRGDDSTLVVDISGIETEVGVPFTFDLRTVEADFKDEFLVIKVPKGGI